MKRAARACDEEGWMRQRRRVRVRPSDSSQKLTRQKIQSTAVEDRRRGLDATNRQREDGVTHAQVETEQLAGGASCGGED